MTFAAYYCSLDAPAWSEKRRRWVCGECIKLRSGEVGISECNCPTYTSRYCWQCSINTDRRDTQYYLHSLPLQFPQDPGPGVQAKALLVPGFLYSCCDCKVVGSPPYGGGFVCGWCHGRMPYTELSPWDISPTSPESCRLAIPAANV